MLCLKPGRQPSARKTTSCLLMNLDPDTWSLDDLD
jgi:hypothetical protein